MERHDSIQRLKHAGEFPEGFCERVRDGSGEVRDCIRCMLSLDRERATVGSLKKRVAAMLAMVS